MGNDHPDAKKSKNKLKIEDEIRDDSNAILIFSSNIPGKKKKADLTNQDALDIMSRDLGENVRYFAIYDGHGAKGRDAADGLKKELRKRLINDKNKIARFRDITKVEVYFKDLYKSIQKKLANSNEYELSGTCAISVLIVENKMFCINLGDSRCVLGQKKGEKGEKYAVEMSIDHKPTRDDEKKRITEKGGEVSEKIPGAPRVFRKNDDVPGLAVSRSIGDIVAHECGVISEPEVCEKEFDSDDLFIVIGSDGIWDAMSSTEVVGYIFLKMEQKKEMAVQFLAEECRNRWEILNLFKQKYILELNASKEGGNDPALKTKGDSQQNIADIDDITAIIHFLNIE